MKKSMVMPVLLMLCLLASGCAFGSAGSMSATDSSNTAVVQSSSVPAPATVSDAADSSQPAVSSEVQVSSALSTESQASIDGIDEKYLTGLGDIEGIVLGAHADGLTCEGGAPELSADGQVATMAATLKAEIVYTDQTVFLLMEYTMATDESSVRIASADDVAKGRGVAVWGGYENEKFVAEVVRVLVPV